MINKKIFIAIAGNIGSGKTTLTGLLCDHFGWVPHYEALQENPYLADFYQDMARWSFPLQIYFLTKRFEVHQKVASGVDSAIQDRSIYEDANIFARNLVNHGQMQERDYRNYLSLYQLMSNYLAPPDLILYLRKSLPVLKERIAIRKRDFEKEIPDQYLDNLNQYYDHWIDQYEGRKLIVDSDDLDFLNNPSDFRYLLDRIKTSLESDPGV